jgi:hypothetical protein
VAEGSLTAFCDNDNKNVLVFVSPHTTTRSMAAQLTDITTMDHTFPAHSTQIFVHLAKAAGCYHKLTTATALYFQFHSSTISAIYVTLTHHSAHIFPPDAVLAQLTTNGRYSASQNDTLVLTRRTANLSRYSLLRNKTGTTNMVMGAKLMLFEMS